MSLKYRPESPANSNLEFRQRIAELFSISEDLSSFIRIIDTCDDLILVKAAEGFPLNSNLRKVRGQIINTKTWQIVANNVGFIEPLAIYKPILETDSSEYLVQSDTELVWSSETKFYLGYESIGCRIFDHEGKRYFSTMTKIDAMKSHWGNNPRFYDILTELYPEHETVELKEGECRNFLIIHPTVNLACSYLETKLLQILDPLTGQLPLPNIEVHEEVSLSLANQWIFPTTVYQGEDEVQPRQLKLLTKPDGTKEVHFGACKGLDEEWVDARLYPGDFIVAVVNGDYYRLETPRYLHANYITEGNPTPYNNFFIKAKGFVNSLNELAHLPNFYDEVGNNYNLVKSDDRVKLWSIILSDAIGPRHKAEAQTWDKRFHNDIKMVANFIVYQFPTYTVDLLKNLAETRKILNMQSQTDIRRILKDSNVRLTQTKSPGNNSRESLRNEIIRHLTFYESAESTYKLVTSVKKTNQHLKEEESKIREVPSQ